MNPLEDTTEATARPAWTPPEESVDTLSQNISHGQHLLGEFQLKLQELVDLVNEMGGSREVLDGGFIMSSVMSSKRLASGRTKVLVNMKFTLPPIKAEVTF